MNSQPPNTLAEEIFALEELYYDRYPRGFWGRLRALRDMCRDALLRPSEEHFTSEEIAAMQQKHGLVEDPRC